MVFVGTFLVGREGGDAGGVGGFDDGVEVDGGFVRLDAEVGEVEGDASCLPLHTGYEQADLHLKLDGIDVYYIVGMGVAGT